MDSVHLRACGWCVSSDCFVTEYIGEEGVGIAYSRQYDFERFVHFSTSAPHSLQLFDGTLLPANTLHLGRPQ